jgi:hypothetical protein
MIGEWNAIDYRLVISGRLVAIAAGQASAPRAQDRISPGDRQHLIDIWRN